MQDGGNKPSVIRLYPRHHVGDVGWELKCAQTNSVIAPAKANTGKLIRVIVPVFIWEGNEWQLAKHHHGCLFSEEKSIFESLHFVFSLISNPVPGGKHCRIKKKCIILQSFILNLLVIFISHLVKTELEVVLMSPNSPEAGYKMKETLFLLTVKFLAKVTRKC